MSYLDLDGILAERGVELDHATLNSLAVKSASAFAAVAHRRKAATRPSWRFGGTYVKVRVSWFCLYRVCDLNSQTLDSFCLSIGTSRSRGSGRRAD